MSVVFVHNRMLDLVNRATMYGEQFPSDDVKAYWSMVPDDVSITVEWSPAFGIFFVFHTPDVRNGFESDQPRPRMEIYACDAFKLSAWMAAIAELVNGKT